MTVPEKVHKYISQDLKIRVSSAITTNIVQKMCVIQNTYPLASIGLGRALTGAILMASQMKAGHRIGLHFKGDGPLGTLFAEANFEGEARGYVHNPHADMPLKNGHLDVGGAVGKGLLSVAQSLPFEKQPHNGVVQLVTGEIGDDIAHYLFQSAQIASIVSLSVYLDGDGSVLAAGGVLIELLPGPDETLLTKLEERAKLAPPLSKQLAAGLTPKQLAEPYTHGSPLVEIDHGFEIQYTCRCSRERVDRTLVLLGKAALAEMVLKGEDVPVTCQFCGQSYLVAVGELRKIQHALHAGFDKDSGGESGPSA